ncbi:hypothetical protein AVEN_3589-1 [Araneus ventricosus]|uniref:Uncharacterized protein n=1 Tax=Araneus ventricosus TaxID=182803 RepID=A0A4Y2KRE1_ARAVE|nr:hypothetical protein AVEN_3589-1 [Araneus ventricosus]
MTRTTPELALPSPSFHATPTGRRLVTTYDLTCNRLHTRPAILYNISMLLGSAMELGFEPGALWPQIRDLNTGHRGLCESQRNTIYTKEGIVGICGLML